MEYESLKEIIEQAIEKEREAFSVYSYAAKKFADPSLKKLFEFLSHEELKHQEILKKFDVSEVEGGVIVPSFSDSRMVDFLVDKPLENIDSIQDVFIFGMKRERLAQQFYENVAESFKGTPAEKLLRKLADEEKKHLDKLETIYDEKIISEN